MKRLSILTLLLLGLTGLLLTACGSSKKQQKSQGFADEPKWAASPPDGCGVGITKYRGNRGMARSTSTSRARDDLARQLQVKVEGMIKDYQAQGTADGEGFNEERTTQVSRQIVSNTLLGTKVQATYVTETEKPHYYSLVCLKPESIAGAFDKMDQLSMKQRKALKNRAEKEFNDLDDQLKKYN